MAFEYSAKAFVKVYRKLIDWEWYTDTNTKALFLHCLLRANWKAGQWKGIHYDAGEFITSLPSLAEETGLSIKQVRIALGHLTETGEVASNTADKRTGKKLTKCRIITVNNWNKYQPEGSEKGNQNGSQNGSEKGRQGAGKGQQYKNNKEYIRNKKEENPLPPEEKRQYAADDEIDWDSVEL